jgi:cob(I)alamin adenosyltransferase
MAEDDFNEPRFVINRVYTRGGDRGETSLVGGQRLPKNALRIEAYGTLDELNAFLGGARQSIQDAIPKHPSLGKLSHILLRVQHELFNLGSVIATKAEDIHPKQPRITADDIVRLEGEIDEMNAGLSELRSFVLPGGNRLAVDLHVCRTVCRRAERLCVALAQQEEIPPETIRYLNRLSDALFVWSRWVSCVMQIEEVLWNPNIT